MTRTSAVGRVARIAGIASMSALLVLACGCATAYRPPPPQRPAPPAASTPSPPEPAPPVPQPGGQVGTTASGGSITVNHRPTTPAVVDSTPSEDAREVLRTIPEPLGEAREESAPDSAGVPVPEPTQPLGDRPGTRPIPTLPESLAAPAAPPPATAPPTAQDPRPPSASADTCWRVQVMAPPERARAERLLEAASSQLRVPFVIEREGGLYKVRTRDCLGAVAANDLRRRAEEIGFPGAFRFRARPR